LGNAFMVDTGVAAAPAPGTQVAYGAASNGRGWRVIWSDGNDNSVRTSGIGADGTLFDPAGKPLGHEPSAGSNLNRSITATGSGFMAVWTAGYSGAFDIWAARLDSAGALMDSFPVIENDSGQNEPAVAFDNDSTCLVVCLSRLGGGLGIYAARVTTGGRVLDPEPFPVAHVPSEYELWPTVAFGRGVYLVSWTSIDSSFSSYAAKAARVSTGGTVLDTAIFLHHDPAALQAYATVAFGDTCFLASWSGGSAGLNVYAARVSASGNIIDTAAIQLSSSGVDVYPSAGFDGTRYLVAWCGYDATSQHIALRGRRITVGGVPLDAGLIRLGLSRYDCLYPSVAANPAGFFVAFTAQDTAASDTNVCCVRISPDGAVLDSGIFFPLGPDVQSGPSGASDGNDFLAAWLETRAQRLVVSAARIHSDGTVLDPIGFPVSDAPGDKACPATGFGDSLYLVAWGDYRGADKPDIYCARVTRSGHVLDPDGIVVCNAASRQDLPDISFDGTNFLVVWQDHRSGTNDNIYAARVSPAGLVLDPAGFVVAAADSFADANPAVCFTGADHLVVWQGLNRGVGEVNIYGALVSPAGAVVRPRFVVSDAVGDQVAPAVASGPTNSLVAWEDNGDIYAARVGADGSVLDWLLVAGTPLDEQTPRITSDASGFRVLWTSQENADSTIFAGARVDTAGEVSPAGDWFGLPGSVNGYDAVLGSGPELLLLFSCLTDTAQGRYYGVDRLWGKLGQVPGIEMEGNQQLRNVRGTATVVRGVLFLPANGAGRTANGALLDICGRKVLDLMAGTTDVSRLTPGVYFVREAAPVEHATSRVTRVVIVR
jgi:hypothetical protein